MLNAFLIALVLAGPGSTTSGPSIGRSSGVNSKLPVFEFADATGSGMGTACACAAVTDRDGNAMTFSRTSVATCMKGSTFSNIQNGDLITCAAGTPRVMYGGRTSADPYLGLLIERAKTNIALGSEEFENAVWTKTNSVVAAPTVTANQAIAPDNTLTADRVQFAASTGAQYSVITQTTGTGAFAGSVFIRGNGTSGSFDLDCHNGSADSCTTCSYVDSSWTRCSCTATAGTPLFIFGNYSAGCSVARDAADVFVWGGQIEASGALFVSSYMKTTTAATFVRARDFATFPLALQGGFPWSMAATWVSPTAITGDPFIIEVAISGGSTNRYDLWANFTAGDGITSLNVVGGVSNNGPHRLATAGTVIRASTFYDLTSQSTCVNDSCAATGRIYVPFSPDIIVIGGFNNGTGDEADGVVKRVCFDNRGSARCR